MGKFTFGSAMLAAALVAMPTFAQDAEESSSTFTSVTDLSSSTDGWYQIKMTTGYTDNGKSLVTNNTNYVLATNKEYNQGSQCYLLKYGAEPTTATATSFFHIKGTSTSNVYTLQSTNGHYLGHKITSYTTAQNIYFILDSDAYKVYTLSGTQYQYPEYYAPNNGTENPLVGGYGAAASARYQLSKVDIDQYDVYTVKFVEQTKYVVGATYTDGNLQVACNSVDNLGLSLVYNDGKFFFPKGTEVTADMFSLVGELPATATKTKITIDDDKNINIGYEKETLSLEDGAVVKFVNVGTDFAEKTLYMTSTGLAVNTTSTSVGDAEYFVVKKLDNNKYAFINAATGTYLKYAGKYNPTSSSANQTDAGLIETYNSELSAITLVEGTKAFNTYYLVFAKRSANATQNQAGTIIISSAGAFDGWNDTEGFTSTGYSNLFRIQNVKDYTYHNINLQAKNGMNYASLYLPFSYTLPDDVKAYYGESLADNENSIVLKEIEGNVVPKATAVVLASESVSGSQTLVPALNTTAPTAISNNKLSGTLTSTVVESGKTYYGFTGKYDTIGFYKWTGETLPIGKAYIALDSQTASAQAFSLSFDKGNVSGINNAAISGDNSKRVYFDLSGRQVKNPTKGIYVVNGKKVIF